MLDQSEKKIYQNETLLFHPHCHHSHHVTMRIAQLHKCPINLLLRNAFYKCSRVSVTLGYCSIGRGSGQCAAVRLDETLPLRLADNPYCRLLLLLLCCSHTARDMPQQLH